MLMIAAIIAALANGKRQREQNESSTLFKIDIHRENKHNQYQRSPSADNRGLMRVQTRFRRL